MLCCPFSWNTFDMNILKVWKITAPIFLQPPFTANDIPYQDILPLVFFSYFFLLVIFFLSCITPQYHPVSENKQYYYHIRVPLIHPQVYKPMSIFYTYTVYQWHKSKHKYNTPYPFCHHYHNINHHKYLPNYFPNPPTCHLKLSQLHIHWVSPPPFK